MTAKSLAAGEAAFLPLDAEEDTDPATAAAVAAITAVGAAATSLAAGDAAIVQYNTEDGIDPTTGARTNADSVSIVLLKAVGAGTTLYLSDRAWTGTAFAAAGGDGTVAYVAPTDLAAGTVVTVTTAQLSAAGINLADSGETLYLYQGGADAPGRFLFAADVADGNTTFNGSLANTGLTAGVNAVALAADNGSYAGQARNAPVAATLADIANNAHWAQSDTAPQTSFGAGNLLAAPDRQVFVAEAGGANPIVRISGDTATSAGLGYAVTNFYQNSAGTDTATTANHLYHPTDIALDTVHDRIFLVDSDGVHDRVLQGSISQMLASPNAPSMTILYAEPTSATDSFPTAVAVDPANGQLYFTVNNLVERLSYNTANQTPVVIANLGADAVTDDGSLNYANEIALDPVRRAIYVVSTRTFDDYVDDGNGGAVLTQVTSENAIFQVANVNPGDTGTAGHTVTRLSFSGGYAENANAANGAATPQDFEDTLGTIKGIDVDTATGTLYFATNPAGGTAGYGGGVYAATVSGANATVSTLFSYANTAPYHLQYLDVAGTSGQYYVTSMEAPGASHVYSHALTAGTPTQFATLGDYNGAQPLGLDVESAPVLSVTPANATLTEAGGAGYADPVAVAPISGSAISDPDAAGAGATVAGAQVRIVAGYQTGAGHQDVLTVNGTTSGTTGGIAYGWNAATGVMTFSGAGSFATYTAVLGLVRFNATGDDPTAGGTAPARTIAYSVFDGLNYSDEASASVAVAAVNDAPRVTAPAAPAAFAEDSAARTFSAANGNAFGFTDPDGGSGSYAATLSAAHGLVGLASMTGLSVTGGASGTGSLTVAGTASAINAALAAGASYQSTADYYGSDTLSLTVSDGGATGSGGAQTGTGSVSLTISAVADAVADNATVNENASVVIAVQANDSFENPVHSISVAVQPAHGTATVSDNGTATASDDTIVYTPAPNYYGTDSFTYAVTSGGAVETATVSVTVNQVNQPPVVDLNGAAAGTAATLTYLENAAATAIAPAATVTDADSPSFNDGGFRVTYVSGSTAADQLAFQNQGNGAGQIGVSGNTVSYGGVALGNYRGGLNGAELSIGFTSGAATPAAVQALARAVVYSNTSDDPATAPRTLTFSVNDGSGQPATSTGTATATVTVTAVNDAPTAAATPLNPVFTEGAGHSQAAAVGLFGNAAVSTVEAGQTITQIAVAVQNLRDGAAERLVIDGTGIALDGRSSGTTAGNGFSYSSGMLGNTVAVVLTRAGGVDAGTAAGVINGAAYQNVSIDAPTAGDRQAVVTVLGDSGGIANGGQDTAYPNIASTIHVVSVNDAPTGLNGAVTTREDTPYVFTTADFPFTDAENNQLAGVRFAALPGSGRLTDNGALVSAGQLVSAADIALGGLVYTPAANATGPVNLTFQVQDDGGTANGGADTDPNPKTLTLNVQPVNDAPLFTSPAFAITRVSTDANGAQVTNPSNGGSFTPTFSPDGGRILFYSNAANLVPGDTNNTNDIFIKNLASGAVTRVSTDASGAQVSGASSNPSFSPDGTKVVFDSFSIGLVTGDTNGTRDIFLKDLATGTVTRLSTDANGAQVTGSSIMPSFSPDGSKVLFQSLSSGLVAGDTNNQYDVFIKDLATGAVTRVSTDANGGQVTGGASTNAVFSPDGTRVAFLSAATNLVTGDTNGSYDIFVKNLSTGAVTRVTSDAGGAQATGGSSNSDGPAFSPDGTKIVFSSALSTLVPGDTNDSLDIFIKDLNTGAISRLSTNVAGAQADSDSYQPVFSPDGTKVAFYSYADNLVPGVTSDAGNVFVKDLLTGAVTLVSTNAAGVPGDDLSGLVTFSPDGNRLAFVSAASNLVPGDTNGTTSRSYDLFVATLDAAPPVFNENGAAVQVTSKVNVSDVDNANFAGGSFAAAIAAGGLAGDLLSLAGQGITVSGNVVSYNGTAIGTLTAGATSLSVALNAAATPAAVKALAQAVSFTSTSDAPGTSRTVHFTLTDGSGTANGGADTASFDRQVIVTPLNDAPAISVPAATSFLERHAPAALFAGVSVTDADLPANFAGGSVTLAASGTTTGVVSLLAGTGFAATTQNGVSTLSYTANGSTVAIGTIAGLGTATVTVSALSADVTPDRLNALVHAFGYAQPGQITAPSDVSVALTVNDANNGGAGTAATTVMQLVHATPVNDAPFLASSGSGASYIENGAPVAVAPSVLVFDDQTSFAGGSLSVALTGGTAPGDALMLLSSTVPGQGVEIDPATHAVSFNGTVIGAAADTVVTLNASATPEAVQALAQSIAFLSSSDDPGAATRQVTFTFVDGGGTANGGQDTTTLVRTVAVTPVDDPAVAADDTGSVLENGTITGAGLLGNDRDVDGPALRIAAVNGQAANVDRPITLASGALLTVHAGGTYDYDPHGAFNALAASGSGASNTQATDRFGYTLAGGGSATVTVTVNGVASPGDLLLGSAGDDTITGTPDADFFDLRQGGSDRAAGGGGNDAFFFGPAFDTSDAVDGGVGTNDQVGLQGNYANLVIGQHGLDGVEQLVLLSSSDTRFGSQGATPNSYVIHTDQANVAPGQQLTVSANGLMAGENLTFDGSAETDGGRFMVAGGQGVDTIIGGTGDDGFLFGDEGRFAVTDHVEGGGGNDQMALRGDYAAPLVFQPGTMTNIGTLVLLSAHDLRFASAGGASDYSYAIKSDDANVAAGHTLTVQANGLRPAEHIAFDGSAETDGHLFTIGGMGNDSFTGGALDDRLFGGVGADTLTGGGGADTFIYRAVAESTANAPDTIVDFGSGDVIDLSVIDADPLLDGQQGFTFVGSAAFSHTAGELRYDASTGALQGDVDADGIADFTIVLGSHPDVSLLAFHNGQLTVSPV